MMLVGLALRAATINTRGLWVDETSSILQASGTLIQTIQSQLGGTHPPLFHMLLHGWMSVFGPGVISIRSFAMVFGVLAIPAAFWAGRVLYDRRVGLIAAGILTLSPYHIWYSQEARMYTMLMFFALLSVGCFALALDKNERRYWWAYFAVCLLGAFTHYLFLLLLIGQGIYYVVFEILDREIRLGRSGERHYTRGNPRGLIRDVPTLIPYATVVFALAVPVIMWLDWAVFFPPSHNAVLVGAVINSGLGYGAPSPSLAIRFNDVVETVVELVFGSHNPAVAYGLVAMWPLTIYFGMLLMGGGRYVTRRTTMLLCSASGMLVVWGLGQWSGVVLLSRYLMPMAAPALILLASVIAQMRAKARNITIAVGVVICLLAYTSQSFDPNSILRYNTREVVQGVAAQAQPDDLILYEPFYIDVIVNYYLPRQFVAYGFPRFGANGQFRDSKAQLFEDLARIVGPARRVWIIRGFQNVPDIGYQSFLTDSWFKAHGFELTQHVFMNKGEWVRYDSTTPTPTPSVPATGGVAP